MTSNCTACYGRRVFCRSCATVHCGCWWSQAQCPKAFRAFLNATDGGTLHRHNGGGRHIYQQRTRKYGDYLYAQDRVKFNVDFAEAREGQTDFTKWLQSAQESK